MHHPYHTTIILFPTLCILISLLIMLTLHHRALTRLLRRIFQRRRNRNYRRINADREGEETGLAINPRTWEYWAAEYEIYMWTRDDDDDDDDDIGEGDDGEGGREMEDMEVLWRDSDSDINSDSSTQSESEPESGSESESRFWSERQEGNSSQLIFSSDQRQYTSSPDGNESPILSDGSVCGSPLGKYFDPSTTLLLDEVLEPASPVVGNWERRMEVRVREGRGLRAWIDWAVDRVVRRVQRVVEER